VEKSADKLSNPVVDILLFICRFVTQNEADDSSVLREVISDIQRGQPETVNQVNLLNTESNITLWNLGAFVYDFKLFNICVSIQDAQVFKLKETEENDTKQLKEIKQLISNLTESVASLCLEMNGLANRVKSQTPPAQPSLQIRHTNDSFVSKIIFLEINNFQFD